MNAHPSDLTPLTDLDLLEAESLYIFRELLADCQKPVMLYSIGKDSAVLLHLARKAFYPSPLPFPLLHVDTSFKFKAMYQERDRVSRLPGVELLVYRNEAALAEGINCFSHGATVHTDVLKTQALKMALNEYQFDLAIGGARRDEEASRAKERVFSLRSAGHHWDPKRQRPELWSIYNGRTLPSESVRVFPLSNWTERDVWRYIEREQIPVVDLYFAKERPVIKRSDTWIMVDDERLPLEPLEKPILKTVRFRTLGCYPLTGAIESTASCVAEIVAEMQASKTSERQGRLIDHDTQGSMERKKQEGYF
jgi:sulfate adenylyltransferase subunit 2